MERSRRVPANNSVPYPVKRGARDAGRTVRLNARRSL
jgi:hypothetical protein